MGPVVGSTKSYNITNTDKTPTFINNLRNHSALNSLMLLAVD